jgi:hypothetical protein
MSIQDARGKCVRCDLCQDAGPVRNTDEQAEKAADWSKVAGGHLCPKCTIHAREALL